MAISQKRNKDRVYLDFITQVRQSIQRSRYQAARLVNKELLLLHLKIGSLLNERVDSEGWGTMVIRRISSDIQRAFPGIKGFSARNLFYMLLLYREYAPQLVQTVSALIDKPAAGKEKKSKKQLVQAVSALVPEKKFAAAFFNVGFSHHMVILSKCKSPEERIFYMTKTAEQQWSYRILDHHIDAKLFRKQGKLQSNFRKILPAKIQQQAIDAFRDEYLLDFINVHDTDNENVLEQKIVGNLRKFLLSLGNEFAFVGNQYRLVVDEEDFFIDLLFYHRKLRCLVAFELKTGKFKPEYTGKMNFYLSALDDLVRMPHENPSIGIILCKEKSKTIVEYAFRDTYKPIGVATVKYTKELPGKWKGFLPGPDALKKLMN
ncbi:MAG: hypothetical protein FD123_3761 [Bacteroidetes bacterium]|nr:MAG: hypothetical protein FD123_3761 [Bacteroidota bacterium]